MTQLAFKQARNRSIPNAEVQSQPVCFNEDTISLHCNQSKVSISTSVFEVYMLQVKVNRGNYISYVIIYIT